MRATFILFLLFPIFLYCQNVFPSSGNVGIGTTAPNSPLQVLGPSGDIYTWGLMSFDTNSGNDDRGVKIGAINGRYGFIQAKKTGKTNNADLILNPGGGNVGVGTNSPTSKLSVNGGVESEEIMVKADVADYVFSPDYKLISIEELEKHIKKFGYLPNIQNQKDVISNNGFVKVGELSISLMEKIEELTLHLIALNKKINQLEQEILTIKK